MNVTQYVNERIHLLELYRKKEIDACGYHNGVASLNRKFRSEKAEWVDK